MMAGTVSVVYKYSVYEYVFHAAAKLVCFTLINYSGVRYFDDAEKDPCSAPEHPKYSYSHTANTDGSRVGSTASVCMIFVL